MTKKRWVCRAFWPPDNRDDQKTVGVSSVLASRNQGWAKNRWVGRGGCLKQFGSQKLNKAKNSGCAERFLLASRDQRWAAAGVSSDLAATI